MKKCKPLPLMLMMAGLAMISHSQVAEKPRPAVETMKKNAATLIGSSTVNAAFAKGMPLIESPEFKIHAARRDAPGVVEIHARDTDIFHIIDGAATFITGGTGVEPNTTGPDEIRATDIKDGETHHLRKGDVIIIPKNVPHWFKTVEGTLLYYVVKVTDCH